LHLDIAEPDPGRRTAIDSARFDHAALRPIVDVERQRDGAGDLSGALQKAAVLIVVRISDGKGME
jgi:hypothetical protein